MKKIPALLLFTLFAPIVACSQPGEKSAVLDYEGGTLIVASKSGDDVYFIDRTSGETLAILPTGAGPHEVEVSDDGRVAVVCNYGDRENPGNTLTVYDVKGARVEKTINLGQHTYPHGMQWIAGTNNLLVTTEGSESLLMVDVKTGEILSVMNTGEKVSHMVVAIPGIERAFVPSIASGNVVVFDLTTGNVEKVVYSGEGAEGIDASPDGREVWITNRAENTITILDAHTLEVLMKLPCADFPIRARFTPDGTKLLVSNARSGTIAIFDALEKSLLSEIKLTPPLPPNTDAERYFAEFEETSIPIGLVIPDNDTAYVANTRSDVVSVIDLNSLTIVTHFKAGKEPDGINFSYLVP